MNNDYEMTKISKEELIRFLTQGTFTGKLATTRRDGRSHVVPVWFVLDNKNSKNKIGNIVFTTYDLSVKAKNIKQDNRVSVCIDDQTPPFSFATIFGTAKIYPYKQKEILEWATKIAERYVGKKDAKTYGEVNSGEGAVLVRIKPTKVIAEKDVSILD